LRNRAVFCSLFWLLLVDLFQLIVSLCLFEQNLSLFTKTKIVEIKILEKKTGNLFSERSGKIDWKIPAMFSKSSPSSLTKLVLTNAGVDAVAFGILALFFDPDRLP